MGKRFIFADYKEALKGANTAMKENILERAQREGDFDWAEFKALVDFAYPDLP